MASHFATANSPDIMILHASGANRDGEAARACTLAGGIPEIVHINQLRRGGRRLRDYQMLLIPGGFSYGDALGAGTRLALDLEVFFHDELQEFVASGRPVLGICNGFQTLVKAGLLPGWRAGGPANRSVTLTENHSGRFECRWVHLAVEPGTRAGFLDDIQELIFCPVAHGEGNFQVKDEDALQRLESQGCVALRYVDGGGARAGGRYPVNPNGSVADIAGICNPEGNVLGLMPHPEDHLVPLQSPLGGGQQLGLALFQAMLRGLR